MLRELSKQQQAANGSKQKTLKSPYGPQQTVHVDYPALVNDLKAAVSAVHQELDSADCESRSRPALGWEKRPKRKPGNSQANVIEIEDEEGEAKRKRAKPSLASECPSTPDDIIDLT